MSQWIISFCTLIIIMIALLAFFKHLSGTRMRCCSLVLALVIVTFSGCNVTGIPEDSTVPLELPQPTASPVPLETTVSNTPEETAPPVSIPEDAFPAGTYEIGSSTETPAAGVYVFFPYSPEVYPTLSIFQGDEKLLNISPKGQFIWSLREKETLTFTEGYFLPADAFTVSPNNDGSYSPGMYRPGIDIPCGIYLITPDSGDSAVYWSLFDSISGKPDTEPQSSTKPAIIDISDTAAIQLLQGLLTPYTPVLFPDAPAEADLKDLPETYKATDLVTPYWQQCITFPDSQYYISLPEIYPFSQEAISCQQEIYDIFEEKLRSHLESVSSSHSSNAVYTLDLPKESILNFRTKDPIYYYGYAAGLEDDILAITVRTDMPGTNTLDFSVYCFDLSTGSSISTLDILNRLEIITEDIQELISLHYKDTYSTCSESAMQKGLDKTASLENISESDIVLNVNRTTYLYLTIYPPDGGESYKIFLGIGHLT